ncbi:MAG: N-acetyl-D-muramate 6-phosphate phosphatase [Actinomycetota bacterium]
MTPRTKAVIFDLDGTLLDSDRALVNAFVRCGVPAETVTFGHLITDECERLGIAIDDYFAAYDPSEVQPFDGVAEMLAQIDRYAIASHKDRTMARAELRALGWTPEVALFAQDFGGPKSLELVLAALGLGNGDVLFVGDTAHDRRAAVDAGVRYVVAGWNVRAERLDGDVVADRPGDILALM